MAEKSKPPLPEPTGKGTKRSSSSTKSLYPRQKYILPLPVRTFPLPTFYPSNPVSLIHLAVAWLGQIVSPPKDEPATIYHGEWSPETRSVHVTDSQGMNDLWCQGFFGKGSLSRSEPSWLSRQKSETSELRTAKRREERADTKWERGRIELEAIEQQKRLEETAAAPSKTGDPLETDKDTLVYANKESAPVEAELAPVQVDGNGPNGHVVSPTLWPPIGPLELLALPNSDADLRRLLEPTVPKDDSNAAEQGAWQGATSAKELAPTAAEPNKQPQANGTKLSTEPSHMNGGAPLQDIVINGAGHQVNGHVKGANGANGKCDEPNSTKLPARKQSITDRDLGNGHDATIQPLKRQKSVRFSPNVESTTFQHSDPPSPNHSSATSSKRSSAGCLVNGKTTSLPRANGNGKISALSQETSVTSTDSSAQKLEKESGPSQPAAVIINREHLQLSAEEAFFLAYGVGALSVTDPETERTLSTKQLFTLFRQNSYFPPRPLEALASDDPFLVHYAVYHHFRSLGWVPRHGIKFGVDWLLYAKGPALDHAEFGIVIIPSYTDPWWREHEHQAPRKTWQWLHSVIRVLSTVFKSMVIVYVDIPPPLPLNEDSPAYDANITELLGRFKIREVMVRRWSSNRNRD